ncbi:MAG: site-specific integrase [Chromatiaceae bacterium]|nr:site-specific integrase [Chromatiaceae bacterium]
MTNPSRQVSPWSKSAFDKTTAYSKMYSAILSDISDQQSASSETDSLLRVLVLASGPGGLAQPQYLVQLIKKVAENQLRIDVSPIGPYVEFDNPDDAAEGNKGYLRWFVETHTLAAIHALVKMQKKSLLSGMSEKKLLLLANTYLRKKGIVSPFSSLTKFCEAASMFAIESADIALPAYLANYSKGDTASTSLSDSSFGHLWSDAPRKFQPYQSKPHLDVQREPHKATSRPFIQDRIFLSRLRDAIRDKNELNQLIPISYTFSNLAELTEYENSVPQELLLAFITSGLKERGWKRSSALTYLSHIGTHWLNATSSINLEELDENQITELFVSITNNFENNLSASEQASVLHQFFVFNNILWGIACPNSKALKFQSIQNVRNYLIAEQDFIKFLNELSNEPSHKNLSGQGLVLCAIIMGRCGLRPNEVIKLRIKDVEPSPEHYIFIRENQYGKNKTLSAKRKIPLYLLLTPTEFDFFKDYYARKISYSAGTNYVLFSQNDITNTPYTIAAFYKVFSPLLSSICREAVTTYHLRHKAISMLQMVLCSDLLLPLSPYSEAQVQQIRAYFKSDIGKDVIYQIAAFAGHLSPETTLQTYMHFTDVVLFEHLSKTSERMNRSYWENLSGLSKHIITRHCSSDKPDTKEINQLLLKSLCGNYQAPKYASTTTVESMIFQPPSQKVTFQLCLKSLELLDEGKTISQVSEITEVDPALLVAWYDRAGALANLRTTKGKPRLFPANSKRKITPIPPPSVREQQKAEQIIIMARSHYKNYKEDLCWLVQVVIKTAINSHSYLQFNDVYDFKKFTTIASKLTIPEDWRVHIDPPLEDRASALKAWRQACPNIELIVSDVKKSVRSKKLQFGRAYVHFLSPRDPSKKEVTPRKSSNGFKFVCHILAIMIADIQIY